MSEQETASTEAPELTRAQQWGLDPIEEAEEPKEEETSEEEEPTEVDENTDDSESDEDDEPEDDEEEEEKDEEDDPFKAVNDNLKKAVQAERTKRKEAAAKVSELEKLLAIASQGTPAEKQLKTLKERIKEHELEDVFEIEDVVERDPEVQALLDEKAKQMEAEKLTKTVQEMQTEVSARVAEFPEIDTTSEVQGNILGQLIMTAVQVGNKDIESAVEESLTALNTLLESKVESFKKTRQPVVKPRKKNKTVMKAKTPSSKSKFDKGDTDGFFRDIGARLSGE